MTMSGLFVLVASIVYVVTIVRRRGERFEFAAAMFMGEFGLMFVVEWLLPGRYKIVAPVAFGLAMLVTALVLRKLFRQFTKDGLAKP
jgi:hypothetical protein